MIKKSIAFMTLALALSSVCQAQSRKIINLPSWDFSRDGKAWQQVDVYKRQVLEEYYTSLLYQKCGRHKPVNRKGIRLPSCNVVILRTYQLFIRWKVSPDGYRSSRRIFPFL